MTKRRRTTHRRHAADNEKAKSTAVTMMIAVLALVPILPDGKEER